MSLNVFFFILSIYFSAKVVNGLGPILETLNGKVEGTLVNLTLNYGYKPSTTHSVYTFLGIPYAQPPIGSLRFKNSIPVNSWSSTLNGKIEPKKCMQQLASSNAFEDCLFLNIYVPGKVYERTTTKAAPIFVWIHGGAFVSGSSTDHPGTNFAALTNVIVITINYRLGPFGFLYVNGTDALGNQGLFDQLLAFKWISANAERFGGDNSSITIGGQSAGAFSVKFELI